MKWRSILAAALLATPLCLATPAKATQVYLDVFNDLLATEWTKLDSCVTCHSDSTTMTRNPFGQDFENELNAQGEYIDFMLVIWNLLDVDTDGDGYDLSAEVQSPTYFPGDPLDYPGGPGGTPGCYDFDGDMLYQYLQGTDPVPDPSCSPSGDCDDTDPFVRECCVDADGDGFSSTDQPHCEPLDCNDDDPAINPAIIEVCGDGIDNNCDGYVDGTDPALSVDQCCADDDNDGFSGTDQPYCGMLDCDDSDPAVHPGVMETCGDGIDNNCDGYVDGTDPALSVDQCCADDDGDTFSGTDQAYCGMLDCDDSDPAVHPGVTETCGDGIDNNCDTLIDQSDPVCEAPCTDGDIDGFYAEGTPCGTQADCNDDDYYVNPAASEVCNDNLDNNCDGFVDCLDAACVSDPACIICTDEDGDGYAVEGGDCGPVDCDDTDLGVHPGAVENCDDARDNDCDDLIDCVDADCNGAEACTTCIPEASKETRDKCQDTLDNDCDGVVDCADPDCAKDKACK